MDELSNFETLSSHTESLRPFLSNDSQQPLMLDDGSSLSEVQALPALILDTSVETQAEDLEILTNDEEINDNEDIVWRTSQYYGIDLVTFCENSHLD